jgi:mono/diheme cytochrome c family protein
VSAGAALFQANCAACHGADGRGGGPDAGTTQVPPANLQSGHLDSHSDGDVFYWITNGLPGGMPAWGTKLSTTDRWNLVNFLRSIDGHGPTPGPTAAASASAPAGGSGATPGGAAVLALPVGLGITFGAWFVLPGRRERRRRFAPAR